MFISTTRLYFHGNASIRDDQKVYKLIDTTFTKEIVVDTKGTANTTCILPEVSIIQEYKNRYLNVSQQLGIFYSNLFGRFWIQPQSAPEKIELYRSYLDKYYPELEYSKKYYNCVLRQLNQRRYGKNYEII